MSSLTSANGFLTLLDEEPELRVYALEKLNQLVDEFWAEIAFSVDKIILLAEDASFPARELASLVAAKVYYHLGEFERAMHHALGAGKHFDVFGKKTEFVETLVAKFVDEYIKLRVKQIEALSEKDKPKIDDRLERIVMNMFDRCYKENDFKPALGIALESRRLDKLTESIANAPDVPAMLSYAFKVSISLVSSREFRHEVLRILVDLHAKQSQPDYVSMVQCLVFLDDSKRVADVLHKLLRGDGDQPLLAFQIAFDLNDIASQQFRKQVREQIPSASSAETAAPAAAAAGASATAMEVDADPYVKRYTQLKTILSGEVPILLGLEFLYRNNHADLAILKNIKTAIEGRNSVAHSAAIFANALMNAGTTKDTFLRENLEWLAKATNWAKFSATAGLGVIHKGHIKEGLNLLSPYLPQPGAASSSQFSEGGALFALGIIHANHGDEISKYLLNALRAGQENEVVSHGACLGLGVAAMATGSEEIYEAVKGSLFLDSAVAGEAAGLAMGLVMLGTASKKALDDMLTYAHETQHEKIIRGLAMGIALVMCGRQEQADTLIEQLILDKDPILRYGGMYTIGLAYAGTASDSAIRRLLHVAVSDVSDDVRRAAVTNIGFLLFRQPKECPRIVSLLAASYNPHVRYGAALAVGISCAGTALKEALEVLEPLSSDVVDFVRQGALIGLSMVLIQTNKTQEPKVEAVRKQFEDRVADKHEEILAKFGAILGAGIIDAGGRNVTLSLASRSGHSNLSAIVGMAVFTQFWYWFPLVHFISLAFTPTAIIGLNKDLKMVKFQFKSNAKPSLFAYPPAVKPPVTAAPTKAAPAILSTAAKAKARKKDDKDSMELTASTQTAGDAGKPPGSPKPATEKDKEAEKEKEAKEKEAKDKEAEEKKPEPAFELLQSPARVTPLQLKFISFEPDGRYQPVKRADNFGIVVLRDTRPSEPEELVSTAAVAAAAAPVAPAAPASSTSNVAPAAAKPAAAPSDGKEPEAPAPFEFDG